jgi:hypothetical protein
MNKLAEGIVARHVNDDGNIGECDGKEDQKMKCRNL